MKLLFLKKNRLVLLLILIPFLLNSCTNKIVIKKDATYYYNKAINFYINKEYKDSINFLSRALALNPSEEIRSKSYFYLGKESYLSGYYPEAVSFLTEYVHNYPKGDFFSEAVCILASITPQKCTSYFDKIKIELVPPKERGICLINLSLFQWREGRKLLALQDLIDSVKFLSPADKKIVKKFFESAYCTFPEEIRKKLLHIPAIKKLQHPQIDATIPHKTKIYTLLPLNGAYSPIGTQLLEDILYSFSSTEEVTIGNTWGDPLLARLYFRTIPDKITPILSGPILSWELKQILLLNKLKKIPILTVNSSYNGISRNPFIFRVNLTPESIAKKIVTFARENNLVNFALFFPDNKYGKNYAHLFSEEVTSTGGRIVWEIKYDPHTRNFRYYFWKVLGIKDRKGEDAYFKQLKETEPHFPVDAVFIPDTWDTVSFLIPQFGYFGMDKLIFLCTRDAISPRNTDILQDYKVFAAASFYAFSDDPAIEAFEESFENYLNRIPEYWDAYQVIESQIIKTCYRKKMSREKFRKCVLREKGFQTFLGNIKFKPNGEAIIPLKIFTVEDDEWKETEEKITSK